MTSDPSIILFGKKIGLPEPPFASAIEKEERQNREEAIAIERLDEHTLFTPYVCVIFLFFFFFAKKIVTHFL